ncbi:beta-glucosidase [Penicillium chermesinum]|nr:beta-glucosidase [Penicillium chermesinum]
MDTRSQWSAEKQTFIDSLVANLTIPDMVLQMHLMFADNIIGPNSDNALYDYAMQSAPGSPIGVIHDWYPTNKSQYNDLQRLNRAKSHINIPFMQTGECLHGVGSFKQSMFPAPIGMAASFDTDLIYRVGRAIGTEARSIGIHACFAPVLDLAKEPRWGRAQEDWGEDSTLTAHLGVAFASGLSKNSTWSDSDAVVPVMKHFAAHGSPQGGHNAAPFMGYGAREVLQEMLIPFKAAVELGGVKGVMMAYSEFDDVPCSVNPLLYEALAAWGYDGFVTADDTGKRVLDDNTYCRCEKSLTERIPVAGLSELLNTHLVTDSVADTISQWHNSGGMIQYYDFPLDQYINATASLVSNGTLSVTTLRSLVRRVLGVKYDLGLFDNPYIPEHINSQDITDAHAPLTLEAAQKSIVLLENKNSTLPIRPDTHDISRIFLGGPFSDTFNFGDYSGQYGGYPVKDASTIRQAILEEMTRNFPKTDLVTSWGANSWDYNGQYNIPPYLLSHNGTSGGLLATYYADTNFTDARYQKLETPSLDWGLYPPQGLPSNNFSVVWEGRVAIPVDAEVDGWFDGVQHIYAEPTPEGNILSNIPGLSYTSVNGTAPPPGSSPFRFEKAASHKIRLEYQAWNYVQKFQNANSLNAQVLLFWNLVDQKNPIQQAVDLAQTSDLVILAVGAAWNSDGESGDRATLQLSPNQTALASAILDLGKPTILVLQGGRPFAIPQLYNKSAAVLNSFFPGQSGGAAIADILFGKINPGGRVPISVPYSVGTLPAFYNYKPSVPREYTDTPFEPLYPFGYGLSYSNFSLEGFQASAKQQTQGSAPNSFDANSLITFSVTVTNTGAVAGSYVPQVYLLGRISSIVRP